MNVRRGMGKDIERLLPLFREMYSRSRYAAFTLDEKYVHHLLCQIAMANAGRAWEGAMQLFLAEDDSQVHGFILPVCDRLYHIGKELMVSDLFFYVREGGDPAAAAGLADAMETWANAPGVVFLWPGVTDAIEADTERTANFWRRRGYRSRGVMLEKEVHFTKPAQGRSAA